MPQPVIPKSLGTCSFVLQVRVPETPERLASCLVISSTRVDVSKFLQCLVQMATKNVRERVRFSVLRLEQKLGRARADELP